MRPSIHALALVLGSALFACGGMAPESSASTNKRSFEARAHVMKWHDPSQRKIAAAGPPGAQLQYYGGQVISNVNVIVVFWGGSVDPVTTGNIGGFFSAVTNSTYMDWLSEYNTNITAVGGQPGTNQFIGRGGLGGQFTISPSNPSTALSDTDIQAELAAQINAGAVPVGDGNTLYMLYFPPGISITLGASSSCVAGGFCAYHGTFFNGLQEVYYGVHPDFGPGSGCDVGCGGNPSAFNNLTSVSSHEMIEAITDAEVGLATVFAPPLAWYDSTYGEIGDICNAQQGTAAGYVVQLEWSNVQNNCVDQ